MLIALLHACSSYSDSHDNLTNATALCARMNVDASTRVSRAWSAFDVDTLKFANEVLICTGILRDNSDNKKDNNNVSAID